MRELLIGCTSQRFQLAVCAIISDDEDVIKRVHSLMVKLRTPLLPSKLYEEISLRVKLSNDECCTSFCAMLKRHVVPRDFLCILDNVDLDRVLLLATVERRTDGLLTELKELSDVAPKLQLHSSTICQTRAYFDSVLNVFPTVKARLKQSARILHSPVFKSVIVMIQYTTERDISTSEKRAVCCLLFEQCAAPETDPLSYSIVERVMKLLKSCVTTSKFKYHDTFCLFSTSNISDRMFSIAWHALTGCSRGNLPHIFENQPLL